MLYPLSFSDCELPLWQMIKAHAGNTHVHVTRVTAKVWFECVVHMYCHACMHFYYNFPRIDLYPKQPRAIEVLLHECV